MTAVAGSDIRFTRRHVWVRPAGEGVFEAGITDYAQESLADIVFVEAPEVGTGLMEDTPCGVIESVKTASDLYAPLSGKVLEHNPAIKDAPELINDRPYQTWIFRFLAATPGTFDSLLDATQYQATLSGE